MRKLNTKQKVVFTIGILGIIVAIFGRYNGWEYMEYFPIFYSSMGMIWISFLPNSKSCFNPFKKKQTQKS